LTGDILGNGIAAGTPRGNTLDEPPGAIATSAQELDRDGLTMKAMTPPMQRMPTGRKVNKIMRPSCHRSSVSRVACDLSRWYAMIGKSIRAPTMRMIRNV
jgi:hypothetical protein